MNILSCTFKSIVFISFCVLFSVSCKQELEQKKSDKTAYITIDNNFARTVNPILELDKMKNIVLKGTLTEQKEEILGEWENYNDVTKASVAIIPGVWSFTLTAQQGGMAFFGKIDEQEIVLGANRLKFDLELSSIDLKGGTGNVYMPFIVTNSSDDINYKSIYYDYTLKTLDGKCVKSDVNTRFSLNNTHHFRLSEIPAGTYFIDFVFFDKFIPSSSTKYIDGELGTYKELINVTADCTSSKEVTYIDIAKLYKITYELNDGEFAYSTNAPYSYSYWEKALKLPMPRKTDYLFDGWYTNPDFSGERVTEIPAKSYGDKVFYAKWKPANVTYTVNYYKYYYFPSGSRYYEKVGYASFEGVRDDFYDVSTIMPKTYYDKNGEERDFDYCFRGYTVQDQEPVKITSSTYAVYYEPNTVTVTFDLDGGNIDGKQVLTYSGEVNRTIPLSESSLSKLEKEGYSFLGFEDEDGFLYTGYYPSVDKTYKAKYSSVGEFKRYAYSFQDSDIRLYGDPTKSYKNDSGAFTITQSSGDGCFSSASSVKKITLPRFYIAKTELTEENWSKVYAWATNNARGEKKYNFSNSYYKGSSSKKPVTSVTYNDAVLWCNAASELDGFEPYYIITKDYAGEALIVRNTSSNGYRLPSEKEWEFAARSGYSVFVLKKNYRCWEGAYPGDPFVKSLLDITPTNGRIYGVGSFKPNPDGLYDMCGNVGEFCDYNIIRSGYYTDSCDKALSEQLNDLKKSNSFRFPWPLADVDGKRGYSSNVGLWLARNSY